MAIYNVNGEKLTSESNGGSPIEEKSIAIIGDSNMQYSGSDIKSYLEETYGCNVTILAQAGFAWEYTSGDVTSGEEVTGASAIGRVNSIVANADSSNLITEYDYVIFMMGTNCYKMGSLTDTSDNIDTMCGAMRYCMEKMCYYGRKIKLGVVIPIRCDDNYNISANMGSMPEKFQYVQEIARQYSVPTLNMWDNGRIIPNSYTPDGTNYYLNDNVHLGANGNIQFQHILGKWIAYCL